jgi:formamidopyrimidine-DNA glycosylase
VPELPEVETVRAGLARWVTGARITGVEVLHPRPVRRHEAGPEAFASALTGTRVEDVVRRGKFLWLELDCDEALLAHLGMSGQLVLQPASAPLERHLRVRMLLSGLSGAAPHGEPRPAGEELELRFVDQRMFGGLALTPVLPTPDGLPGGRGGSGTPSRAILPVPVRHIARDVLDPYLDVAALTARLRARRTGIKRALLDQGLVSGIGNIYADEALWRARLHYDRPTATLTRPAVGRLLDAVRQVMGEALAQGGTSFDSLYVNVNGQSGYFDRSLAVYGRQGQPCLRCGCSVRRDAFMNRSSFTCPRCQPRPRRRPPAGGPGSGVFNSG